MANLPGAFILFGVSLRVDWSSYVLFFVNVLQTEIILMMGNSV